MKKHFFQQWGQSLLEVVFATTIVALVLTTIAASVTVSLKTASQSKYRSYATFYSEEAMEFFKRERVRLGYTQFRDMLVSTGSPKCITSLPNELESLYTFDTSCSTGQVFAGTEFSRSVAFDLVTADKTVITVTITWYDGNREEQITLDGVFKDY